MGNADFILFIICLLNMSDTNQSSSGRTRNLCSGGRDRNASKSQRIGGSQNSAFSLNFAANQTIFVRSRRGQYLSTSQTPQQTSTSSASAAVTCSINFVGAIERNTFYSINYFY